MIAVHLDEEQVQRVLHGQLAHENEALVRDHLGACVACRSRVEMAEREEGRTLDLLEQLDHPAPRIDVESMMTVRRRRLNEPLVRWAAGILLTLAVGSAVYAAPGSPLPALIDRLIGEDRVVPSGPPLPPTPNVVQAPARDEGIQGVAADPGAEFTIEFAALQDGVAQVSLTDDAEIVVRAIGGPARFTSDVNRISVDAAAETVRFEIEVPRRAPRVEIRVGGRRVFLKNGSSISAGPERTADGRYLVRFSKGLPAVNTPHRR